MASKSVIDTLNSRVSIRSHSGDKISDEMMTKIISAARRSPTSSNRQAFSFVVVRDQDKKKALAQLVGNQKHVETSEVFIAVCADNYRIMKACEMNGVEMVDSLENSIVAIVDAAIAGTSLSLAAESFGLGTVMVGGIRNQPLEVAKLLGLPKGVFAIFGMSIGWPSEIPKQKPRMKDELNVFHDKYREISEEELLDYDKELAEHYRREGRDTPDAAWTGIMAKISSQKYREHLRSQFESQGYGFS